MIVKNEEECIQTALHSVKEADEIVVCDTGSIDKTVELASSFSKKVKVFTDYSWNDNFAEARNHSLSKCTCDWIFIIDADERLEPGGMLEIKKMIKNASGMVKDIRCVPDGNNTGEYHYMPRIFKNQEKIHYKGAAHNYLNVTADEKWNITLYYGYSPAHKNDPDRTLNILLKDIRNNPGKVREKYYLAREYYYRKDFITAAYWYELYLQSSTFLAERADAYLMLGRCYWQLHKGNKARQAVMKAIEINANFKEALLLMASMSWSHNAKRWRQFAELADNSNVLFVRIT